MSFETLGALWGLLVLLPILALHLRYRRRKRLEVSSLLLWDRVVGGHTGRRGLQRLRDRLGFAFSALAAILLVLALAGPVTGEAAAPPGRLIVLLDASRTTSARNADGVTRFERLRAAADAALDRLGPGDEVVLWVDDGAPFVAAPPTHQVEEARAALARLRPSLRPSTLLRTLEQVATSEQRRRREAREGAARDGPESGSPARSDIVIPELLILTDGTGGDVLTARDILRQQAGHPRLLWTEHQGVLAERVAHNAAISDLVADPDDPTRMQVRVRVTDGRAIPRELVVQRGDVELKRLPVTFPDGPEALLQVQKPRVVVDDVLHLALDPPDAFPADDVVRLELRARRPWRIGVLAPQARPSPFLVAALRALSDASDGDTVDAKGTMLLRPDPPAAAFVGLDAVIVEGALPKMLPAGLPLIAFGGSGPPAGRIRAPVLWGVGTHAVLRGVDLDPLRMDVAQVLTMLPTDVPLLRTSSGVVGLARESDGARSVHFGFRPDASTLPLEAAFPVLLRNALDWIRRPPVLPSWVRAGDPLPLTTDAASAGARVIVRGPGAYRATAVLGPSGALPLRAPLPPLFDASSTAEQSERASRRAADALSARMTLLGLSTSARTMVNWLPGPDFSVDRPAHSTSTREDAPLAAVAALADRADNEDTRVRLAAIFAAIGVVTLLVGAALLRRSS